MLQEKIRQDLNKFLKERNEMAVSVLRMLVSVLQDKEKKKRYLLLSNGLSGDTDRLSEEEVVEIISLEVKKRKESISAFEKAGREDRALREKEEIKVLAKYLPEQISGDELVGIVKKAIEETGTRDMGKIMSKVMPLVKGKADGSEVNQLVKEMLS